MYTRLRLLITLLAMALVMVSGSAMAATTPYYALATSSSQVYMLGIDAGWSAASQQVSYGGQTATGLSGIAVRGNYAYVADVSTSKLYVLEMRNFETTPTFSVINAVSLSNGIDSLVRPSSVRVDALGNVYVIDSTHQTGDGKTYSTYAYIDKSVATPGLSVTANITKIENAALDDIAITPTGAIIAHRNLAGGISGATYVTAANGDVTSNVMTPLNTGGVENYNPIGVSVNGNLAYIANTFGSSYPSDEFGSLSIFNTSTWDKQGSTYKLPSDLVPSAVTAFTRGTDSYLALMGTGKVGPMTGVQQAWLYSLDASGNLGAVDEALLDAVDYAATHKCAVSSNGEVFWFTNKQAGTVRAWSTTDWGSNAGTFSALQDGVGHITAFDYTPVPEPAGLVALMSFTAGMIGFIKRKRLG